MAMNLLLHRLTAATAVAVVDSDRFRSARDYVWRAVMQDELAALAKPAASQTANLSPEAPTQH